MKILIVSSNILNHDLDFKQNNSIIDFAKNISNENQVLYLCDELDNENSNFKIDIHSLENENFKILKYKNIEDILKHFKLFNPEIVLSINKLELYQVLKQNVREKNLEEEKIKTAKFFFMATYSFTEYILRNKNL